MKLEYRKVGDYYLPNIVVPEENIETKGKDIGKYGRLRLNYLKGNNRVLYQELLLDNRLHEHLVKINDTAKARITLLINSFAEEEKVDEILKANNQLEWFQRMNNIKNRAEEIVLKELIYD